MRFGSSFVVSTAAAIFTTGCLSRTVEIRPVAPVAESRAIPVGTSRPDFAAPLFSGASGASGARRQGGSAVQEQAPRTGVQVEAVIPGMSSGRSLSFEKEAAHD